MTQLEQPQSIEDSTYRAEVDEPVHEPSEHDPISTVVIVVEEYEDCQLEESLHHWYLLISGSTVLFLSVVFPFAFCTLIHVILCTHIWLVVWEALYSLLPRPAPILTQCWAIWTCSNITVINHSNDGILISYKYPIANNQPPCMHVWHSIYSVYTYIYIVSFHHQGDHHVMRTRTIAVFRYSLHHQSPNHLFSSCFMPVFWVRRSHVTSNSRVP